MGALTERFWRKVDKSGDCWLWTGAKTSQGYGKVIRNNKQCMAHRLVMGDPEGKVVMHKCDTPLCCNPDHLSIGTRSENLYDMYRKGRQRKVGAKGETNGANKLSSEDVKSIRASKGCVTQKELAMKFQISTAQVSRIMRRTSWSHI